MSELEHHMVHANGVVLHVVSSGPAEGPAVLFCHGFPENWYSWRHQVLALAHEGYRVYAHDWRGYGTSSCPDRVGDYGSDHLTSDLCALLDHFGYDQAIFVGHDWGAAALWEMARLHPRRVSALYNMSVPFTQAHHPPLERYEAIFKDQFFYINYFQPLGLAEAELEANTQRFLRNFFYSASGEGMRSGEAFKTAPREGTLLLDTLAQAPYPFPSWLSEDDIDQYVSSFLTSGFFGPLSFYRNMDANWRRSRDVALATLTMPVGFLTGSLDPVRFVTAGAEEAMSELLANFRGVTVIEDAGHWIQQERPAETTRALFAFLAELG
jgi:pimeloyl-ACP methyl ester carboxylesterase